MPLYDFACPCGMEYEDLDMMSGPKVRKCPECGKKTLVRLIGSGGGFHFGTGYKDLAGQSITFKEPYFDTAMRRHFTSAKEKFEFMKQHKIVEAGDSDIKVKQERKQHIEQKMDTRKGKKNG